MVTADVPTGGGPRPADERRHQPPADALPQWAEAWSFWFHAVDAGLAGWVSISLHPGAGVARYRSGLWQAGQPMIVAVVDDEVPLPRAPGLEIRSHGLWADHICETPLDHWTVTNETHALGVADPEELIDSDARGDIVPLALDLEWEDTGAVVALTTSGGALAGYTRAGRVSGEILVGRDALDLDGAPGGRDHRWGIEPGGSRATVVTGGGEVLQAVVDIDRAALDSLAQGRPAAVGGALLEPVLSVPDRGGFWPGDGRRWLCRVLGAGAGEGSAWLESWPPTPADPPQGA